MLSILVFAAAVFAGESGARPAIAKDGLQKSAWVQLNPWFPVDMSPVYDLGGPNVPYQVCADTNSWRHALKTVSRYGIDGVLPEVNFPGGGVDVFRSLLDGAATLGRPMKVGLFCGFHGGASPDEALAIARRHLAPLAKDLRSNPHVARIGGRPVMLIYNSLRFRPAEWLSIFSGLEKTFGGFCFLFNYSSITSRKGPDGLEAKLREYLPVFDGVSAYNYSMNGIVVQRREIEVLRRVMADNPGKIFMGGVFSTYTQHFNMAGLEVHLSRDWRASVDAWIDANPDAIEITNLFDHYENSLVFPCYEREDLLLRYLQYKLCEWRGSAFPRRRRPELVLCNHTSALLGWTSLDYEILAFPIEGEDVSVSASIELCNASGRVLRTLGPANLKLDQFREVQFSVPSTDFIGERGIVPRLVYTWKGDKFQAPHNPMTLISPSIRPNRMYWARSTANAPDVFCDGGWTLDGVRPGGTRCPRAAGTGVVSARMKLGPDYLRHGVKRDGVEWFFTRNVRTQWNAQFALPLPVPGQALHWYHLELQARDGRKFQTLPIWESDGMRDAMVEVPIRFEDGSVRVCGIEGVRVPFFHWPCDSDDGQLLVDVSGYEHNARIDGKGYGGGHLGYTGYNLCHNGPVAQEEGWENPFKRDSDGRGFLRLAGRHYIVSMGGTAMPGASTCEISVRPRSIGRRMGLICGSYGKIDLTVEPDGRVCAARRSNKMLFKTDRSVSSLKPLVVGEWTRLAVVYDLKKMDLYVNGGLQGSVEAKPNYHDKSWGSDIMTYCSHEFLNELFFGAEDSGLKAVNLFDGDIREVRVYGRNLAPSEFL